MKKIYQINTLGSLMSGYYDGVLSVSDLLLQGDFGLGTFDQVDGEMIVLDGKAYRARGDNTVEIASPTDRTPYAALVKFDEQESKKIELKNLSSKDLDAAVVKQFQSLNLFHAVKIEGTYQTMRVRMAPKTASGTPFDVVSSNQPEHERKEVTGTLVGLYTPELFAGASLAGFHWHFLSADKDFGGHIISYQLVSARASVLVLDQLVQDFPSQNSAFLAAKFDMKQIRSAIEASE